MKITSRPSKERTVVEQACVKVQTDDYVVNVSEGKISIYCRSFHRQESVDSVPLEVIKTAIVEWEKIECK